MMTATYLLAIDQGTTGSTVLVVEADTAGQVGIIGKASVAFAQHFPQASWVEHELDEVWASVRQACHEACAEAAAARSDFNPKKLAAIGLTNQRETLCIFDRQTLKPLRRAIVWQCKRSLAICRQLQAAGAEEELRQKTGLFCDPYFTASKIRWVMQEEASIAGAIRRKTAGLGTMDTYLMARLSGGSAYVTEASNASRTLLFNIHTGTWASELLELFGLPPDVSIMPELQDSAGVFAKTRGLDFLPDGIPIAGVLGDQQAALAGQGCLGVGDAKCTYGTGAFLLVQAGKQPPPLAAGVLSTVAWQLKGQLSYAREGAAFIAGAAVQFLRDNLGLISSAAETQSLAATCQAAPQLYFVPALSGLGAPRWLPEARGAFLGLTRSTSRAQLARACLEGIALQVHDLMTTLNQDGKTPLKVLRCDGGASANTILLQIQADLAQVPVERAANLETTALGAALFAGLGVGLYCQEDELKKIHQVDLRLEAASGVAADQQRRAILAGWERAVAAVALFAHEEG